MTRVLIVTADIGAGHDLPARLLADALTERGAQVSVADAIEEAGPVVRALLRSGSETVMRRLPWLYELQYWLALVFTPTHTVIMRLATLLSGRGVRRLIARERPDVIISTYPGATEVLARLRRRGLTSAPLVSAITDLSALRCWVQPDIAAHLIIHAESAAEVAERGGGGIAHVRGMVRPGFEHPPTRAEARAALGLPDGPLVLVSGGGWGVGQVEAAADAALAAGLDVACLCGTNDALRARLGERGIRALGFTDQMVEWMSAADVLVHSTAGLTMLEAQLCGTHAISFGWGVGHIRANNRAYARFGLAHVANTPQELAATLDRLAGTERPRDLDYSALPAAADSVLALA